jgi:hypothetical protein
LRWSVEAAYIDAELETAPDDHTSLPDNIHESGLGDVEGELRWRFREETSGGPELFSYFETVFPTTDEGSLIGTTDWGVQARCGRDPRLRFRNHDCANRHRV